MIALILALLGMFLIVAGLTHLIAGVGVAVGVILGLVCVLAACAVGGVFHRNIP